LVWGKVGGSYLPGGKDCSKKGGLSLASLVKLFLGPYHGNIEFMLFQDKQLQPSAKL